MPTEELTFRRYREEDFPEYASVFKAVYGKDIDRSFFRWKHLHNPALDQGALIYLVFNGEGRMIGANSFFPYTLVYEGRTYRAVQSGDTMVLAEYRGRGIFQKLLAFAAADLRQNGYALIYGYANDQSYPGFLKFGFADLGRIHLYYDILNWSRFLERKGKLFSIAGMLMDKALVVFRILSGLFPSDPYEATTANLSAPEISKFLSDLPDGGIHPRKDESYLAWKYRDKPAAAYTTMVVRKNGEIVAVFVIRIDRHDHQLTGEIVEFFTSEQMPAGPILKKILASMQQSNLVFAKIWEPSDKQLMSALSRNLFLKRKVELYFIAMILQENLTFFSDRSLWQVIGGDADTA
ncbi:hypothetical protein JCM15765_26180 [Paradesulfitobacterium aromaticivorans]